MQTCRIHLCIRRWPVRDRLPRVVGVGSAPGTTCSLRPCRGPAWKVCLYSNVDRGQARCFVFFALAAGCSTPLCFHRHRDICLFHSFLSPPELIYEILYHTWADRWIKAHREAAHVVLVDVGDRSLGEVVSMARASVCPEVQVQQAGRRSPSGYVLRQNCAIRPSRLC